VQNSDGVQIDIGTTRFKTIDEMQQETENMHNEVLELIATLSDGTLSDRSSSVCSIKCSTTILIIRDQVYHGGNGLHNR
jgi:hypothetical protein